jgi:hypothetical protein
MYGGQVNNDSSGQREAHDGRVPAPENDQRAERATVRPPFDPARFALESESKLGFARPPPSNRPTPRSLLRPVLRAPPWAKGRAVAHSAPELLEFATTVDAREALGSDAVPVLVMSLEELEWFALSPKAKDLLRHVNGVLPIDSLCSKANIAPPEGATVLLELAEQGIVTFR